MAREKQKTKVQELTEALDLATESNILKIATIEESQRANRTNAEKIAEVIADFCGSMPFVYVHVAWFGGWIILNAVSLLVRFDPFPFTFLTLVVSLEAIFLSTFILINQNHQMRLTERRNHLDLQINILAEQENTKTLELLELIATKVGVSFDDPAAKALVQPTDPVKLVEQILTATGADKEQLESKD